MSRAKSPRLPKDEYFKKRLSDIEMTIGWRSDPKLASKAAYYRSRLEQMEQPLLHQQDVKQLLDSIDEDAQEIADLASEDGVYIPSSTVRTLVGNIQEAIMHYREILEERSKQ